MTYSSRSLPWILFAGDLVALLLFVYVGQRSHEIVDPAQPLLGALKTTALFALPWIVAGWQLDAFFRRSRPTVGAMFGRSLNAWLVAAPLGVLLRAVVLGLAVIPTAFMLAALGFGGLFLIGWRTAFALIRRRSRPPAAG